MEVPALTDLFSAATAKTYTSFLKGVDIKTALEHPNVVMEMFREKGMNSKQINNAFKALRSISRILLKDATYDSSFIHEQYRGFPNAQTQDDVVTVLSSDSESKSENTSTVGHTIGSAIDDDHANANTQCPQCAKMKKLLFYCATHLMDDAKNQVIQTLLNDVYG